ncbi:MAG: hypothetical protein ACK5OC_23765 [Pirellula sp.]
MKDVLDRFGQLLVSEVRDVAVAVALESIRGQMKDQASKQIEAELAKVPESTRKLLEAFATDLVDSTLHDLLSFFEGTEEFLIAFQENENDLVDLNEISDGLAGELVTEEGWISRFSDLGAILN